MDQTYEVKNTEYAEQSMREIAQYIATELLSPRTAIELLRTLRTEIQSLDHMPARIPLTPEEPWHSQGIHRMLVKNYYIYFWIDKSRNVVQVMDVISVRRSQSERLAMIPAKDNFPNS